MAFTFLLTLSSWCAMHMLLSFYIFSILLGVQYLLVQMMIAAERLKKVL